MEDVGILNVSTKNPFSRRLGTGILRPVRIEYEEAHDRLFFRSQETSIRWLSEPVHRRYSVI